MKGLEVQGDVALKPIASLPECAIRIHQKPIALGEVSGHAHVIVSLHRNQSSGQVGFEMFEYDGKTFVAVGGDGASLMHMKLLTGQKADHEAIHLSPNTCYEVLLQKEYNPEAEALERVLD